jgi:hypothetical protein
LQLETPDDSGAGGVEVAQYAKRIEQRDHFRGEKLTAYLMPREMGFFDQFDAGSALQGRKSGCRTRRAGTENSDGLVAHGYWV